MADSIGVASGSEPIRLKLACPGCGGCGWVKSTSLSRGLHCSKCGCQFLVTPTGQLAAQADLPQVLYSCPRCGRSGSIPTMLSVRRAECPICRLPLARGPDQQLHSIDQAAQMHRDAVKHGNSEDWLPAENFGGARWRRAFLAACMAACALMLWRGVSLLVWLFDESVEAQAAAFTRACLAGAWPRASGYLKDDPVQQVEFDRWQIRNFASIQDHHRPAGDDVAITASAIESLGDVCLLEVRLQSDFLGARTQLQLWRLDDGRWWFDSQQTLARSDQAF